MRKGADSFGRPVSGYTNRGARPSRRRNAVWLVTEAAPNLTLSDHPHNTAGALALGSATSEPEIQAAIRHCALIVERDPALAEALASRLLALLEPEWSVRRISDIRLLTPSQSSVPEIIVLDASWPIDSGADSYQRLSAFFDSQDAQMIFVTRDTSYQLSQRGVTRGVVLREWRHPDDIVMLISEALVDDQPDDRS